MVGKDDWAAARAIYEALCADRWDARDWRDLPEHRRWRYVLAAMAAVDVWDRRPRARVIAWRERDERTETG